MQRLDGEAVSVGDRAYHVAFGWGTVTSVDNSGWTLRLDAGGNPMRIFPSGYWQGRRSVYWNEPVLLALPKGVSAGRAAQVRDLVETISRFIE